MAFKLSPDAQSVFFEKVFGFTHPVTQKVKELVSKGVVFETSLYAIAAIAGLKTTKVFLTKGSTSLLKGTVEQVHILHNKQLIQIWVEELHGKIVKPLAETTHKTPEVTVLPEPVIVKSEEEKVSLILTTMGDDPKMILTIKTIREVTGLGLIESKHMVDSLIAGKQVAVSTLMPLSEAMLALTKLQSVPGNKGYLFDKLGKTLDEKAQPFQVQSVLDVTSQPVPVAPVSVPLPKVVAAVEKPKPVPSVIALREAKAIGQKVKGTSAASVYHCVAFNERVRIAARIYHTGSVSIRAEWNKDITPVEMKKLEESGLGMKSGYASMHLDAGGVPVGRVIGAFVLGTGISWTDAVMNASDLVVE